jgi:hypothetical protein
MALDPIDYTVLTLVALVAVLFPLVGLARPERSWNRERGRDAGDPGMGLHAPRGDGTEFLAQFIPMESIGGIDELRAFQHHWLEESGLDGGVLGYTLRHEGRHYWEVMLIQQLDGPGLAVYFSITRQLYLMLLPPAGQATN